MDVVTFGETMVLFTPGTVGPLRYVNHFEKTLGGAESNVAIALSRLGHQVGWFSRLGDDEFGLYVRNIIRGEGVDTSRVIFDPDHPTAVFFKERQAGSDPKIYYYRKGAAASQMNVSDVDEAYIAQAKILHLTGITPALSQTCRETLFHAIHLAKKNGVTVVFDPNLRLKLWSKEEAAPVLKEIASLCDIILPGLDEGVIMTGKETPEDVSSALIRNGARAVVLKLGEKGAFYATQDLQEYVEAYPVKQIVDTVGAGDGFAAGFLSGLIRGWTFRESVQLANRIGAYALSVAGDMEGYPYWNQIDPSRQKSEVLR